MRCVDAKAYGEYLKDESGFEGNADKIYFPVNEEETAKLLKSGLVLTPQGGRTGISACGVSFCGNIINLSMLKGFYGMRYEDGIFYLGVFAGTCAKELDSVLESKNIDTRGWDEDSLSAFTYFKKAGNFEFPCVPTEKTATFGGMFASDAMGPLGGFYGSIKDWVSSVYFADIFGTIKRIDDRKTINTLAGSEGMYGVFTRLELRLKKKNKINWCFLIFQDNENALFEFAKNLKNLCPTGVYFAAFDFIDKMAAKQYIKFTSGHPAYADMPAVPEDCAFLYLEITAESDEETEVFLEAFLEFALKNGLPEENIWAADSSDEIKKFRRLRHIAAEALIHPDVKNTILLDIKPENGISVQFCREINDLSGLYGKIIHLISSICHLCIVTDKRSLERVSGVIGKYKCSVGSENGVGKIKKYFAGAAVNHCDKDLKRLYDPEGRLNPGNGF